MNAGGSEGSSVILVEQPSTPIFGDLNYASMTGLISASYGRYHDPFLNVPLSANALKLIDPGSKAMLAKMWCVGREDYCELHNNKYIDGRLDQILALNLGQPVYPTTLKTAFNYLTFPSAHGGAVDPMWYDWTTTTTTRKPKKFFGQDGGSEGDGSEDGSQNDDSTTEDDNTMGPNAALGALFSTEPALNPDPYVASNCTCEFIINDNQLAKTLIWSAGISSILTGVLLTCCCRELVAPVGVEGIWDLQSEGTDESFEQMLAE